MKKPSRSTPSTPAPRGKAKARAKSKPAKQAAKKAAPKRVAPKKAAPKQVAPKKAALKKAAPKQVGPKKAAPDQIATAGVARWLGFVEQHGVVLASARGPVPSVAEAVAGEPIVGSWWAHARSQAIFEALSAIDDSFDVRCFKLVDGKVTFVHRRAWPALVRLARDGVIAPERVASVQQEHSPTGEHQNIVTPFPEWVPDEVALDADRLTAEAARATLGPWLDN